MDDLLPICVGSRFHSPTPLVVREVEVAEGMTVLLCGTCADNIQVYLTELREASGALPWPRRREFGNIIRSLGDKAYSQSSGEKR